MWEIQTTNRFDDLDKTLNDADCAGEKTGKEKRFYEEMIPVADREFSAHLEEFQRGK